MITSDEKEEIINAAVEKALLKLPEVLGNLITNHVTMAKMTTAFYKDHPEFGNKKDVVASVIEMIDGRDPTAKYKDILVKAIPEIKKRISVMSKMDMENISTKPKRDFKDLGDIKDLDFNGEL